jgi:FkbM family methyltransferase
MRSLTRIFARFAVWLTEQNDSGAQKAIGRDFLGLVGRAYELFVPSRIRIGLHNRWYRHHAARWQRIADTPRSLILRVGPRVHMRLYGDSRVCEMIYFGQFEQETLNFFNAFLRRGDVFLDLGANVGLFTLFAARAVRSSGHVHSFEPSSRAYGRLVENVVLNRLKNVSCLRVALSDVPGEADLKIATDRFDAWNSLGQPYMGGIAGHEAVKTTTLDRFAREHDLFGKIAAIKIDVEGWECHVLTGGVELLSRPDAPVLCVEFTEEAAHLANSSCAELYRALERLGYQIFSVGVGTLVPFRFREQFPNLNLLAIKDLDAARRRLGV